MAQTVPRQAAASSSRKPFGQPVLYPNAYTWLLLVSALDGMITWAVLSLGGIEANPIAGRVLETHGFAAMVAYKFALVSLVIIICEFIGRHRRQTGLRVAAFGIAVTCLPVLVGLLAIAQLVATS
jgi:hypothetical protein